MLSGLATQKHECDRLYGKGFFSPKFANNGKAGTAPASWQGISGRPK